MTAWIPAATTLLWAAVMLLIPGLVVGVAFRLRGLWLWAAAGPLSVSVIAVASVMLSFANIPWGVPGVAGTTVVLAVIVALLVRVWWKQPRLNPGGGSTFPTLGWVTALALGLGGALMLWRTSQAIGGPENISQTFDNIFHLNAVRFILDTGDASPLRIGLMNSPQGNLGFYPSGWHALVALVAESSGASIPLATNSTILAVTAIIWVAGAMLLARTALGNRPAVTIVVAVLATGFVGFPLLLIFYGVLYPLFLGLALVPAALATLLGITRLGPFTPGMTTATQGLLVLALIPGIALAHPGAFMGLLAFSVPLVSVWAWCAFREGPHRLRTALLFAGFVAGGIVALVAVRPPREQATWQSVMSVPQAGMRFLTGALTHPPTPWLLAGLVLVGVVVALVRHRKQDFALLGMYAMAGTLFVIVAGVADWRIRFWTTGVWYQNIPRIEAITVLAVLPLAVLGAVWLLDALQWLLGRRDEAMWHGVAAHRDTPELATNDPGYGTGTSSSSSGLRRALHAAAAAVLFVLLLVGTVMSAQVSKLVSMSAESYDYGDNAALVSKDELTLFSRMTDSVPEGATIVTNGWTGAGLAYAFTGRWVTMPHVMVDFTDDTLVLNDSLNTAVPGSKVCEAAEREGAKFVLDFGRREVHGGDHPFPGLADLESSPAVELVDREGEARLYRIVGCDPAESPTEPNAGK